MKIIESHSSSSLTYEYICQSSRILSVRSHGLVFSLSRRLKEIFLPQGYPDSVSEDYINYQIWDTFQALLSTITSTIANQAILKGIGVGNEKATILAATITWIMKDGAGLIGRILFAYWKGTFLDCNCKRWRLFADILNDVAIFMDMLTGLLPAAAFIPIVCVTSVARSIVGVAGGATRAALTMHQARRNNMADVSAKDGSQESLSNLFGLALNLLVVSIVTDEPWLIWSMVICLSALHLYCNYRAVRSVYMSSFNQARLHTVVGTWLQRGSMLSVQECNMMEPVWFDLRRRALRSVSLGGSVCGLTRLMCKQFSYAFALFRDEGYVILLDHGAGRVCILLKEPSGYLEQMKAMFQMEIIDYLLSNIEWHSDSPMSASELKDSPDEMLHRSLVCCNSHFGEFVGLCQEEGWVFEPILLGADEWRIEHVSE